MNNRDVISRRSAIIGALVSTAALAVPLTSRAAPALATSPIPAMVARHVAAVTELKAANAACDPLFEALWAENTANPIMVELPGFRFNHGRRSFTNTNPFAIREFYAKHYGMLSGKSGAHAGSDGKWVFADYSADQERDLALALANYEAAAEVFMKRREQVGLRLAEDRVNDACTELEDAWLALLSYVPDNLVELREKATAVLAIATADPVQLDDEHMEVFLRSLVGVAS